MLRQACFVWLMMVCCSFVSTWVKAGDPNDGEGSQDPALFTRMPGFFIYSYQDIDFDRFEFTVGENKTQVIEGRHMAVTYYANEGVTIPSGLQVTRNYLNAASKVGGQKVFEFEDGGAQYMTLKVVQPGAETWVLVQAASNGMYNIDLIERKLMDQDVTANAESMAGSIRETGKAAIYGIYFDTGKADLKPESESALKEISKLLKSNAGLKLYVVGHTDNVGSFDGNMVLSRNRAGAVCQALIGRFGVESNRLLPYGDGPTAPVASNQTEPGRAKNRRVELVEQ